MLSWLEFPLAVPVHKPCADSNSPKQRFIPTKKSLGCLEKVVKPLICIWDPHAHSHQMLLSILSPPCHAG